MRFPEQIVYFDHFVKHNFGAEGMEQEQGKIAHQNALLN